MWTKIKRRITFIYFTRRRMAMAQCFEFKSHNCICTTHWSLYDLKTESSPNNILGQKYIHYITTICIYVRMISKQWNTNKFLDTVNDFKDKQFIPVHSGERIEMYDVRIDSSVNVAAITQRLGLNLETDFIKYDQSIQLLKDFITCENNTFYLLEHLRNQIGLR